MIPCSQPMVSPQVGVYYAHQGCTFPTLMATMPYMASPLANQIDLSSIPLLTSVPGYPQAKIPLDMSSFVGVPHAIQPQPLLRPAAPQQPQSESQPQLQPEQLFFVWPAANGAPTTLMTMLPQPSSPQVSVTTTSPSCASPSMVSLPVFAPSTPLSSKLAGLSTRGATGQEVSIVSCAGLSSTVSDDAPVEPLSDSLPHDRLSYAYSVIATLRRIETDRRVRSSVMRLPPHVCEDVVVAFTRVPELMMEVCKKERGNVLASLIERLGGESADGIVQFALDNIPLLARDQSGCIALQRMMDHMTSKQLDVCLRVSLPYVNEFIMHPFGNFIVKQLAGCGSDGDFAKALLQCNMLDNLSSIAMSKFGSHALEDIIRHLPLDCLFELCTHMFGNIATLRRFLFNSYANYCVQHCLQVTKPKHTQLYVWCSQQVRQAVPGSPYQQYITKYLAP